jgi:hypothetical protein
MSAPDARNALSTANRLGLLGDLHGDLEHLFIAARTMRARGVDVVIQLGDFGVIWPGENWPKNLDKISRRLGALGMTLFVIDGNHEAFPLLFRFPVGPDGLRLLRHNIAHLPRGYRTTLSSGRTLATFGGANSIDRALRTENVDWWPEESPNETDLAALGREPVDILLGHEAPLGLPELDKRMKADRGLWPAEAHTYSADGRRMFHRAFLAVRPRICLGAHYHRFYDHQCVGFGEGHDAFECRVVTLDQSGPKNIAQAILDVETLDLWFFRRDGADPFPIREVGDDADR